MKNNDEKNLVPKEDEEFEKAAYDSERIMKKPLKTRKKELRKRERKPERIMRKSLSRNK